jgi:hypothetical protein
MPRTRYTRLIHDLDEALLNQQRRDLDRFARRLRRLRYAPVQEPIELPATDTAKDRRRARLARKRRLQPVAVTTKPDTAAVDLAYATS